VCDVFTSECTSCIVDSDCDHIFDGEDGEAICQEFCGIYILCLIENIFF
jgi:hypothetical protein